MPQVAIEHHRRRRVGDGSRKNQLQRPQTRIQDRYAEVGCPVHLLWGEDDAWLPLEQAHTLVERVPGATLRTVADAGHLVQEDSPESVVAAVLDTLAAADLLR